MKTQMIAYIVLLSALINGCANGDQTEGNSQAQMQVDALAAMLANRDIGRVEILQIPPDVETAWSITPEMLEKHFYYKLTISDIRASAHRDKLVNAMKSIAVVPQPKMPDIRWGVILYDLNGVRAGAIYFDKWGKSGAVGDVPVSFKGKLFKWLDRNFSCCFR